MITVNHKKIPEMQNGLGPQLNFFMGGQNGRRELRNGKVGIKTMVQTDQGANGP